MPTKIPPEIIATLTAALTGYSGEDLSTERIADAARWLRGEAQVAMAEEDRWSARGIELQLREEVDGLKGCLDLSRRRVQGNAR